MTTLIPNRLIRAILPALALVTCAFSIPEGGAVDVVRKTVDTVTTALGNEKLDYAAKRAKVEGALRLHVDKQVVAKLVMGRNWKKLDEAQQKAFVSAFMDHLLLTYWDNIETTDIAGVGIASDREEKRGDWTVKTKVDLGAGKEPVLIDYRLRRKKSDDAAAQPWLIIDFIVEGVSMVSNFRAQFQEVYSSGGAQHLIDAIVKKNKTLNKRLEKKHSD
jgi:phospholipid transport system substrate-binding protein